MNVKIVPENKGVYGVVFDDLSLQMRKCGNYPMWNILLHTEGKWKNICFVSSSCPPFTWMIRFIGTGVTTVQSFRDILLNKCTPSA